MTPEYAVTHNGKFHADDVFASAMLKKLFDGIQIIRSRDESVIQNAPFVFDVGGSYDHALRRYDHHQLGAPKRSGGLTRSAFGLLWLHYGEEYCGGDVTIAQRIDDVLVRGIDARDNGELISENEPNSAPDYGISQVIEQLNPILQRDESFDAQFVIAVGRAAEILERLYAVTQAEIESEAYVVRAHSLSPDPRYVMLDLQISPSEAMSAINGLEYIVFPESTNKTWQIFATHQPGSPFQIKRPLPQEWAGLKEAELAETTGVSDALFCHKKRFLAVAKTQVGARELLSKALE
ncbi:MYG1 family protein [Candidatus Saccharibacteria bacterium]|nr:MYG1 family protein [Candidatus Saccharibacteria bacterium]